MAPQKTSSPHRETHFNHNGALKVGRTKVSVPGTTERRKHLYGKYYNDRRKGKETHAHRKSRQICLHRQELEHERVLCPTRHSSLFFSHAIHCSLSIFTIGCSLISHLVQHNTALAHIYNNSAQHCVMYSMQSPKESKNTSEEYPAPKVAFEEEKKRQCWSLLRSPDNKDAGSIAPLLTSHQLGGEKKRN